ncbi:MAG: anaerobic ribonucleoside-triphosphate reductase activating protein [Eubacteriales bacterium]|nr:anaerobic ribonucleoside-triphosphate reductase activating protein [Eubacteriales bacterium]
MKYHNITTDDMLNGDGLRVVLWVSGCEHKCKNCHNPITWNENNGIIFDTNAKNELFSKLEKEHIQGITFSGGDPLYSSNIKEITILAKDIKEKYPKKDIWLYTGYKWEEIYNLEIMKYLDIVIDGRYIEKLKEDSLHWRGSLNQRIINVKKSLENKKIILYN